MIPLSSAKRVVIKLGTGVLTAGIGQIDRARIQAHCQQIHYLRQRGIEVIVVSSGAIGLGMGQLGLRERPTELALLQACAAVGQATLTTIWQDGLQPHQITAAQILLTRDDLRSKQRHNAVMDTLQQLLAKNVIPIVNENDTVSADEIKFGDNDTLAALVASITQADLLFILSNIPGLINLDGDGKVVHQVKNITAEVLAMAKGTHEVTSVGGMVSKLTAAKIACRAGCGTVIGSGKVRDLMERILQKKQVASYFEPKYRNLSAQQRWLSIQDATQGQLTVSEKFSNRLQQNASPSLTCEDTRSVQGVFNAGSIITLYNHAQAPIAQGLTCLGSQAIQQSITEATPSNRAKERTIILPENLLCTQE